MPRAFTQTAAIAALTVLGIDVAAEFFADNVRLRVPEAAFHVGNNAFKGVFSPARPPAPGTEIGKWNLFAATAIQDDLADLLRQFGKGSLGVKPIMVCQATDQIEIKRVAAVPAGNGTARECQ